MEEHSEDISAWSGDSELKNNPFADLGRRLKLSASAGPVAEKGSSVRKERIPGIVNLSAPRSSRPENPEKKYANDSDLCIRNEDEFDVEHEDDNSLFLHAMEGVIPLQSRVNFVDSSIETEKEPVPAGKIESEDAICAKELNALISGEKDIPVEHTPEYVEGPVINSNPRIVRKLRRGKFSIQGYCDLHGLTARDALEWCEEFMAGSIAADRSCIAFIHGRGLSSPKGPVLKKMVQDWLRSGKWRRHVIAFSSAPNWDGGPGVTYVLLRQRPKPRTRRPKRRLWHD